MSFQVSPPDGVHSKVCDGQQDRLRLGCKCKELVDSGEGASDATSLLQYILSFGGGLLGGDRIDINCTVEADCNAVLATQVETHQLPLMSPHSDGSDVLKSGWLACLIRGARRSSRCQDLRAWTIARGPISGCASPSGPMPCCVCSQNLTPAFGECRICPSTRRDWWKGADATPLWLDTSPSAARGTSRFRSSKWHRRQVWCSSTGTQAAGECVHRARFFFIAEDDPRR